MSNVIEDAKRVFSSPLTMYSSPEYRRIIKGLLMAYEAEKAAQDTLAKSIMGEEAYNNSPCQAHPFELIENYVNELRKPGDNHD